jgi:SPP1 family predicted phage head-tail adaptor
VEVETYNPGRMRQRISLEADTLTYDRGVETKNHNTYATVWAEAESLGGSEALKAQGQVSESNWRFTIRYRDDVLPNHRVIYRGKRMEIIKISSSDERLRMRLILECKTLVN